MKDVILSIAQKIGIDKSIFWSIVNRGFGVIRAPLTIFFIVKYMSVEEQGTWYTFTSLAALTMLADLGFASITTHFVSHEYALLQFRENRIEGDENRLDRFMAFINFSVKFYLKVTFIAILLLAGIGIWYFSKMDINILLAWIAYSLIGGIGLLIAMFQAIYQGLNKVKEIQINILFNSFFITLFTCLTLYLGFKIWGLVVGGFLGMALASIGLYRMGKEFWKQVYVYKIKNKYNFLKETLGLQIRYAVSFIASYLTGFLYVPVIYKYVGAKEAGQMGLLISIVTVIFSISFSWIQTKAPIFNILVSQKKIVELNKLVKRSTMQASFVFIFLSSLLIALISVVNIFFANYASRIPYLEISVLYLCSQFVSIILNILSVYLRAFKIEPLMAIQILNAVLLVLSIFIILKQGIGLSSFLVCVNLYSWLVVLPLAVIVAFKNRNKSLSDI